MEIIKNFPTIWGKLKGKLDKSQYSNSAPISSATADYLWQQDSNYGCLTCTWLDSTNSKKNTREVWSVLRT